MADANFWKSINLQVDEIGRLRTLRNRVERYTKYILPVLEELSDELNSHDDMKRAYHARGNGGLSLKDSANPYLAQILRISYPFILDEKCLYAPDQKNILDVVEGARLGVELDKETDFFVPALLSHQTQKQIILEPKLEQIMNYFVATANPGVRTIIPHKEIELLKRVKDNLKPYSYITQQKLKHDLLKPFEDIMLFHVFHYEKH